VSDGQSRREGGRIERHDRHVSRAGTTPRPGTGRSVKCWCPAVLLLACLAAPAAAQGTKPGKINATTEREAWYAVLLGGKRVGHAHMTLMHDDTGRWVFASEVHVSLRRGEAAGIDIVQQSGFVETDDHEPVWASTAMTLSQQKVVTKYEFNDAGVSVSTWSGGEKTERLTPPIEGDWLTPVAADAKIAEQVAAGAERFEVRTLEVSLGLDPVTMTYNRKGETAVEVFGKVVPAVEYEIELSAMPGRPMTQYLDAGGAILKQEMPLLPGQPMVLVKADAMVVKQPLQPVEIIASTLVKPDRVIDTPRDAAQAVYRVTIGAGDGAAVDKPEGLLPRAGYQKVVWGDERTATVVVDLAQAVNPVDDTAGDAELEASAMINHGHPAVEALAAKLPGDDTPAAARVEAARRLVHEHVEEKDLSVGFASAAEVAQTRQGDCTEHAVLLAAVLRAAGVPSRVASGLVYVERFAGGRNVFAYHMWTQAWVDGRWVDLDATLPADHPTGFDAAHITLRVSAMRDGEGTNDMIHLLPVLGRLEVRVVEVQMRQGVSP